MENIMKLLEQENPTRHKCKICGNDIIYSDTNVYISSRKDKHIIIKGHSYKSTKIVNDVEYKLCVCEKCLKHKFPIIKNLSRTFNIMSDITKFAFSIPDDVFKNARNKYALSENKMIEKYGEIEGKLKWENYCKIQAETNTFEYKNKKYGMTKSEFDEFNKSRSITKNNLIKKYGEKDGLIKWGEYIEKQKHTKSWEYMVEKFGEEKAREINKRKSLSKENFILKYGEKEGLIKWEAFVADHRKSFSKVSQKLFNELDEIVGKKYFTKYAIKNDEAIFYLDSIHSNCSLDYYIPELKICIEFNGGCFHGDPRLFKDDEYCNPHVKLTAKELREKDKIRYNLLEKEYGIKTYVIWELDYKNGINLFDFCKNTLNMKL